MRPLSPFIILNWETRSRRRRAGPGHPAPGPLHLLELYKALCCLFTSNSLLLEIMRIESTVVTRHRSLVRTIASQADQPVK